jgi:hypothetical protein
MRQLEDGSLVDVDEILHALKALDASDDADASITHPTGLWRKPPSRRSRPAFRN